MHKRSQLQLFIAQFLTLLLGLVHAAPPTSCSQTPFPEVCNHFLDTAVNLEEITKPSFRDLALKVTMDQAIRAHHLVSTKDLGPFDKRAKLAWTDCQELYEDSVHLLNRSMSSNDPVDTQTWLSAAIANHQTCQNGFSDFNISSYNLPSMLGNFSKLVRNSLAINKAASAPTGLRSVKSDGRARRLLSDGFPEWVSSADRKLLQAGEAVPGADLVVAQDGSGNFKTITDALDAATKMRSGSKRFVIHVKKGVYNENIKVKKTLRNIMFVGDGISATVVTGSKNQQDGSTTFRSATFGVSGDGFIARDMTFENTAGPQKHQAVAFRSGSDFSVFYRCSFIGYQDTLYVYSQRQFYRECDIYGTQDFIFGDAVAVLQNCNIYVRKPISDQKNTITAQGRKDPNENTGIVIHNSRVMAASDLKPVQGSFKTYLGRPWQKYSRTVFMKSTLDGLIDPAGWLPWNGKFALSTLYYGEYMNIGPAAVTSGRVNWPGYHVIKSSTEASQFTVGNFLAGGSWLPGTGVPFDSGL
ncbi:hypothetical protein SLEP1_g41627 [Rubroshorea leprosula]|uniref:Pectinesterase n=1 Tax=Rubroshorea leprosula TaxID=152421 RepID=A0AAV5L7B6_9ROSI|nr:hypothetical protein SLEP1_g41627 [Rubroshorea leprosula]